jgi:hypothetical protein
VTRKSRYRLTGDPESCPAAAGDFGLVIGMSSDFVAGPADAEFGDHSGATS